MKQVDKRVAEALARLNKDPAYRPVLKWLRESLNLVRAQNDYLVGNDLTISQGKAQAINTILKEISSGEDNLEAIINGEIAQRTLDEGMPPSGDT